MVLGKVIGTVVCSLKNDEISGPRYLIVEKCNHYGIRKGEHIVAIDLVGAGNEEMVIAVEGSSARETERTINKPVDAAIVGIVDMIDEYDKVVYQK